MKVGILKLVKEAKKNQEAKNKEGEKQDKDLNQTKSEDEESDPEKAIFKKNKDIKLSNKLSDDLVSPKGSVKSLLQSASVASPPLHKRGYNKSIDIFSADGPSRNEA